MKADLLHVIEAAYELDSADPGWVQGLTDAVGPLIDDGHGAYGMMLDASDAARISLSEFCAYRGSEGFIRAIQVTNANNPPEFLWRAYRSPASIYTATEHVGQAGWRKFGAPNGPVHVGDCAAVVATDPRGVGCAVMAPLREASCYARRVKRVWSRVAAHVVAMHRLRRRLPRAADARGDGEAVLTPNGTVENASGSAQSRSARALLREAAVARERARGRLRKQNPEEAVELWRALVAGRWSIVDRFERDGRRFLIAHENAPQAIEPRALTPRERQVVTRVARGHSNKLIAYELGLSVGSIGGYLAHAMAKLGLKARLDLSRVVRLP